MLALPIVPSLPYGQKAPRPEYRTTPKPYVQRLPSTHILPPPILHHKRGYHRRHLKRWCSRHCLLFSKLFLRHEIKKKTVIIDKPEKVQDNVTTISDIDSLYDADLPAIPVERSKTVVVAETAQVPKNVQVVDADQVAKIVEVVRRATEVTDVVQDPETAQAPVIVLVPETAKVVETAKDPETNEASDITEIPEAAQDPEVIVVPAVEPEAGVIVVPETVAVVPETAEEPKVVDVTEVVEDPKAAPPPPT